MKVTSDEETTIGILDNLSEHTRKFVLAHELGHVVEHANNSTTLL
ncbi:ImmA/IrrE family metallo-endopeptidase [Lactobacillus salivarius]|nr:ImmA/IrrE family metallo-endopeptidase [Ligilactobacillus salivarius]